MGVVVLYYYHGTFQGANLNHCLVIGSKKASYQFKEMAELMGVAKISQKVFSMFQRQKEHYDTITETLVWSFQKDFSKV